MASLFLKLLNMSIAASWLILAVIVLRVVLKRAPKWIHCILWALVGIRLLCPISIESALSLIPSSETIRPDVVQFVPNPSINSGVTIYRQHCKSCDREGICTFTGGRRQSPVCMDLSCQHRLVRRRDRVGHICGYQLSPSA